MTDLQALVARLEAASEGSRELDAAITAALRIMTDALPDWAFDNFPVWRARTDGRVEVVHGDGTGGLHWKAKPYTTSLDAALTLVPEIWRVYAIQEQYIDPPCKWFVGLDRRREHRESMIGKSSTPALALCIAALKAREAS